MAELKKEQVEQFNPIKNSVLSRVKKIFVYLDNSAISKEASNALTKIKETNPQTQADLGLFCGTLMELRDNIGSAFADRISRSKCYYGKAIVEKHKEQEMEFYAHIDNLISVFKKYEIEKTK